MHISSKRPTAALIQLALTAHYLTFMPLHSNPTSEKKSTHQALHYSDALKKSWAKKFYPLVSVTLFRDLADFVINNKKDIKKFPAEKITRGSIIFVRQDLVSLFVRDLFDKISEPFILITGQAVGTIGESYKHLLASDKIIKWFGPNMTICHPKACPLPLGVSWVLKNNTLWFPCEPVKRRFEKLSQESFFKRKNHLAYLNLSKTHQRRVDVLNALNNKSFLYSPRQGQEYIPFDKYLNHISNSRFVISPRGQNLDCWRTWETLYLGSIPVVESIGIDKVYENLPVLIVDDLTKLKKSNLEDQIKKMQKKTFQLEKLHANYWINLILSTKEKHIEK